MFTITHPWVEVRLDVLLLYSESSVVELVFSRSG